MTVIVTRMPSTGSVTNLTTTDRPIEIVREEWADADCVTLYTAEELSYLPHCETCGCWKDLGMCANCR